MLSTLSHSASSPNRIIFETVESIRKYCQCGRQTETHYTTTAGCIFSVSFPFQITINWFPLHCATAWYLFVSRVTNNRSAVGGVCRCYCCVRHKRLTNHNNAVSLAVGNCHPLIQRKTQSKHSGDLFDWLMPCEEKRSDRDAEKGSTFSFHSWMGLIQTFNASERPTIRRNRETTCVID